MTVYTQEQWDKLPKEGEEPQVFMGLDHEGQRMFQKGNVCFTLP